MAANPESGRDEAAAEGLRREAVLVGSAQAW
jgi:hypothetical protein